jgi:hypothetical protein
LYYVLNVYLFNKQKETNLKLKKMTVKETLEKYRKLYEKQQIAKAERKENLELSTKNLIFNFLKLIN